MQSQQKIILRPNHNAHEMGGAKEENVMARISNRIKSWSPVMKGKGAVVVSMDIDAVIKGNLDTLFDIRNSHKSWGSKWYDMVRMQMYDEARICLIANEKAQGFSFLVAVRCLEELAYLEDQLRAMEVFV